MWAMQSREQDLQFEIDSEWQIFETILKAILFAFRAIITTRR